MAAILGVNIDHVATLRQARGTTYPDPVQAALVCEQAGAEGITLHLREDRRHIQDDDVRRMRPLLKTRMNLELAVTDEMVAFAQEIQPQHVCFVPERRQEVTTEGGLDVVGNFDKVQAATQALSAIGCDVSLFIDADFAQIDAAVACGAPTIEIHTGAYADAATEAQQQAELARIVRGAEYAASKGFFTKSGIMLGLGETEEEVIELMHDLRGVGCQLLTIGQYLQPTLKHIPVKEYIHPDQFAKYKTLGLELGFKFVESGPLVRSSYMAETTFNQIIQ